MGPTPGDNNERKRPLGIDLNRTPSSGKEDSTSGGANEIYAPPPPAPAGVGDEPGGGNEDDGVQLEVDRGSRVGRKEIDPEEKISCDSQRKRSSFKKVDPKPPPAPAGGDGGQVLVDDPEGWRKWERLLLVTKEESGERSGPIVMNELMNRERAGTGPTGREENNNTVGEMPGAAVAAGVGDEPGRVIEDGGVQLEVDCGSHAGRKEIDPEEKISCDSQRKSSSFKKVDPKPPPAPAGGDGGGVLVDDPGGWRKWERLLLVTKEESGEGSGPIDMNELMNRERAGTGPIRREGKNNTAGTARSGGTGGGGDEEK